MKSESSKSSRPEAPFYPLYPLESCVEIGEAVKQLGGLKAPVPKSVLASHLKLAESQVLNQRIGSSKSFGIVRGRAEYTLSETGQRYFFPSDTTEKAKALLAFLSYPVIFNQLIERFDGQKLPDPEILGNILLKESKVPQSWSGRVAGFFVRSAKYAAIIDESGHLRYSAAMKNAPMISESSPSKQAKEQGPTPEELARGLRGLQLSGLVDADLSLPLESGKIIRIPPMTEDDFELMLETLKLWKRRIVKPQGAPKVQE
ncbi:MAG: hypothetical protein HY735_37415 [Verrucomicrobia bacterium]|nr:hypothetical protein [Verrucomicrobiota bacterium]